MVTDLLNTLYVQTDGAHIKLDHDAVVVEVDGRGPTRLPLSRIESIVCIGRVTASPPVLARCAGDGRSVVWLSANGRFAYRIQGPTGGNVLLRRAQHLAYGDAERRTAIARNIVAGKLKNSRRVLLRSARDAVDDDTRRELRSAADAIVQSLPALPSHRDLDVIRGVEGRAARTYFSALNHVLRSDVLALDGRSRRPPRDPLNALLSFLYGLLRSQCWSACETVGLDPQVGFLHGIRPGRPALALDLMEEFRPVIADRLALTLVNRRQLGDSDFEHFPGGAVRLTDRGRRTVLEAWQGQRSSEFAHAVVKRPVPAGLLPHIQARLLARHLRADLEAYIPFTIRG